MNKSVIRLLVYMLFASSPLCEIFLFSHMMDINIEYVDVIPEICYINIMICAYTLITYLNNNRLRNLIWMAHYVLCITSFMIVIVIYVLHKYNTVYDNQYVDPRINVFWFLNVLTIINVLMAVVLQLYIPLSKTNNHENKYENYLLNKIDSKQESNKSQREEVKINKDVRESEPDTDIFAEMLKNYNETREYFKISKFQSKTSFFVSVFSAIAGFIILAVAIYGIINNEHLEVSIIAAISGAITEIASVVVLGIHNKSALQLNYYYDALHENEKLLSAINMADKLNADKREEMYMEIIRKQIDIHPQNKENNK